MDLIFAWELGLRKIILESDFPGGYAGFSKLHHSSGFHPTADHSCKIFAAKLHPHREGSNGAHLLARHSKVISDCTIG